MWTADERGFGRSGNMLGWLNGLKSVHLSTDHMSPVRPDQPTNSFPIFFQVLQNIMH